VTDRNQTMFILRINSVAGIGIMAIGLSLFIWQVYSFLRFNIWNPISVLSFLGWIGIPEITQWVHLPTDWIGLHRILNQIPLNITLVFSGFFIWIFSP
jgi:hypothetical protein